MQEMQRIKEYISNWIRDGFTLKEIRRMIEVKHPDLGSSRVDDLLNSSLALSPSYYLKQKVEQCDIVQDISGDDMCYLLDPNTKDVVRVKESKLTRLCATKDQRSTLLSQIYPAQFTYNPTEATRLYREGLDWFYNTYQPPAWYEEVFYSKDGLEVSKRIEIPQIYKVFFIHLVKDHNESYTYVLFWLANAIRFRNYCVLTAIGNQGIGKGVLGEIMRLLVGEKNFHTSDTRLITKDFNKQFKNKRIVFCDEIQILKTEHVNKFKALINDMIEIEGKGENAVEAKNYASIYIASNNFDSIRLTDDDRRFSIIELTDEKLIHKMSTDQISSLIEPDNIKQLAEFLWHLSIDKDAMKTPFKSARTEAVRLAGLKDWEEWLFDDYAIENQGSVIDLKKVCEAVESEFGAKFKPSRRALKKLQEVYPKKFTLTYKVHDNGKRAWYVKFPLTEELKNELDEESIREMESRNE
jgi:hypothetical protein